MDAIIPYLTLPGRCEEALHFYQSIFGGEIDELMRFSDSDMPVPDSHKSRIMHARLQAGDLQFMASDGMPGQHAQSISQIELSLTFSDPIRQQKVFEQLADGGAITMELQQTFWGALFGKCTDRYGVHWMVNCPV